LLLGAADRASRNRTMGIAAHDSGIIVRSSSTIRRPVAHPEADLRRHKHKVRMMDLSCPTALLHRIQEMSRCISVQDWEGVAGFYGRRPTDPNGPNTFSLAEEEIARLQEESPHSDLLRVECDITPRSARLEAGHFRVTVHEHVELIWGDGCRRVASR